MTRCKLVLALGGSLLMGLAGAVRADTSDADLRAELDRVKSRLAEVEGKQNANWLTERRAEEIKGLVRDMINDADTRASLLADGGVAGHNGSSHYIGSADGTHMMVIWGQFQMGYYFNLENLNAADEEDEGFDLQRIRLGFEGYTTAGGRKYTYALVLDAATGGAALIDTWVGTQITDNINVKIGQFKLPFLREELVSSKHTVGAERSMFNEFFTGNRAEQIQVGFTSDMFRVLASVSDGFNSGVSAIGGDGVEIALTGRVDVKINGGWDQQDDMVAWNGQPMAIFVGGAVHYEAGDGNNGQAFNLFNWTIDGLLEVSNFSVYAAVAGMHIDPDVGGTVDQIGVVVQVAYNINDQWLPFVRLDWIDTDTVFDDQLTVTAGITYFLAKHSSKVTLDVIFVVDGGSGVLGGFGPFGTNQGFSAGDLHGEDNIVIRLVYQKLF